MESGLGLGLCQPATAIVLVAVAGVLYHVAAGHGAAVLWWLVVGVFGGGIFQILCRGGLEPVAWILMLIPVLIVCFFLAVALFAARLRIQNVREVSNERPRDHGGCQPAKKPRCNRSRCDDSCPSCMWGGGGPGIDDEYAAGGKLTEGFGEPCPCQSCGCIGGPCPDCGRKGQRACNDCGGSGCPYCAYAATVAAAGRVPIGTGLE
jgi:hypothetical protein